MPDTLYYDGKCPLCAKEITLLAKLKDRNLILSDIHSVSAGRASWPDQREMLRVLHLKTQSGKWLVGLDANVAAWQHTRIGWLFSPLRWPIIRLFADRVYGWWANRRYCRLNY